MVARHGRGRGACRGRVQGGVKGGFRSMDSPLGIRRYHACGHRIWQRIGAGLYASFVVIFNSLRFIFVQFHFGKDEVGSSNLPSSSKKP